MSARIALVVFPLSVATIIVATKVDRPRVVRDPEPVAEMAAKPVVDAYVALLAAEKRHQDRFSEAADPVAERARRTAELARASATKQELPEIGGMLFVRDFERTNRPKRMAETTRCASCHYRTGPGGSGGLVDTYFDGRNPPALFGAALLEQAAAEMTAELKRGATSAKGLSFADRMPAGRVVKPFGRSGRWATLEEAVREMARGALDVELSREELDALRAFVASLPPPAIEPPDPARFPDLFSMFTRGRASFVSIGCAGCHVPELSLADGRSVQAFTDLRMHDLGADLADRDGRRTWMTAPLWGFAASAPWLHDGRALASLDAAIQLHGGEAKPARDAFERLPDSGKAEIRVFLYSLTPEPKMQVAGQ